MTKPVPRDAIYRRRAFDAETIELCVRGHISCRLSSRDLVELMGERGHRNSGMTQPHRWVWY